MIKMTVRGAPPAILYRTFRCSDCEYQFEMRVESRDAAPPECPQCMQATAGMPSAPHIANASLNKAVGIAQDMMEEMGHTNFRDHLRPGEVAAMGPAPMQTAERESLQREVAAFAGPAMAESLNPDLQLKVKDFWKPTGASTAVVPTINGAPAMNAAPAPAAGQLEATAAKVDALTVLDTAKKWGNLRHQVQAKSDLNP